MGHIIKTEEEWKQQLSEEVWQVTRQHGTERAFSGAYYQNSEKGMYSCICCDAPLFTSEEKYDSGSGWPSFWQPVAEQSIVEIRDSSQGMVRVEVRCANCDAHLGHVFEDGPQPTGRRYCINSICLDFKKA
ncbi:Peptide-methionine (R)-S-oxide reductase MsrB [hydrothermal vent metagenome]|uniref:peptide-methionine (R)-S-oxide reductase n=1 Tax=hydrothermal vent metagenome TaxID=652676 RepID=A0A3B0X638_9ZZZZ